MLATMTAPPAAHDFLTRCGWGSAEVRPLAGDASFRRYFRAHRNGRTAVLMDAPPPHETILPFWAVGTHLAARGVSVPSIYGADAEQGLMLLEDLGDALVVEALAHGASEPDLYAAATDVLVALHAEQPPEALPGLHAPHLLPLYDASRALFEVNLLLDWTWPALTGTEAPEALRAEFTGLWAQALAALDGDPLRLVQMDYHSPNLLWLPERTGLRRIGVLDFQDARRGSAAYDLVSLLQDARRDVPAEIEAAMRARYCAARPDLDAPLFEAAYAFWGAQRATRILGVFVRLHRRDGKPGYLKHIPRMWRLLERNLAYPTLRMLQTWFSTHLSTDIRTQPIP